jgi:putative hemolysin
MDSSSWPGVVVSATSSGLAGADWALVLLLFASLLMAATSAAAETALTSVNRIKLRNLAEEGDAAAKRVIRLLERPQVFLSTILVASNVSIIVASTVSTILALRLFVDYGEIISTIVLSLFVLIFCEITPKTAAVQAPERWARFLVGPVELLTVILRPVITVLTFITSGIVRIFGGQPVRRGPFVTEEELRLLVEVGEEEGVLEEDEREMIHNVFELADTQVREIMVPRIDMVTVEADASVADAMEIIVQGGQSRIPVFEGTIDNIIGVLYAKDLLRVVSSHQQPATVKSLVRPAYFVPESKRLDDLLRELQQQRVHMAIVVDEYGAVAGLVTIEDVVEEIIGDIQDEYDKEEQLFEKLSDNEFIVDAKISIYDFNELLDADLTAESYDTLGGFVYAQLDKIPTVGDVVHYKNLTFTILSTKGRRVTKVKVVRHASNEGTGDDDHGDHPLPLSQPDQLPALPSPHDRPEAGAPHAGPQERDFESTPLAEQEQHDPEPDPPSLSGDRHPLRSRGQSARRHGHGTTTRRR